MSVLLHVADGLHTWIDTWTPGLLDMCPIEMVKILKLTEKINLYKRQKHKGQIETLKT
jgi:hypothetical protein